MVAGQGWFALALPFCVSAVIRKRLSHFERAFTVILACVFCITSLISAIGIKAFAAVDDAILLFTICYASARCILSFSTITDKLRPFIRGAIIVNAVAVGANSIYILVGDIPDSRYQIGLIFYYIAWNVFNLFSIFLYLIKHPENRTVLRTALIAADYTEREKQIIELLCQGRSNEYIADTFSIALNTVKQHVRHIFRKTGVRSRVELAAIFGHRRDSEELPQLN